MANTIGELCAYVKSSLINGETLAEGNAQQAERQLQRTKREDNEKNNR